MSNWISDRLPGAEDGATVQYIGPTESATERHREGARLFIIVDAGYIDYRARCWMSLPEPPDLPPMCRMNTVHDEQESK